MITKYKIIMKSSNSNIEQEVNTSECNTKEDYLSLLDFLRDLYSLSCYKGKDKSAFIERKFFLEESNIITTSQILDN